MFANKFFKILGLKRMETLVASAIAYSDSTTLENFISDKVEGEIGFFNADTGALITGAISGTTRFIIALIRGGLLHKTTPMVANAVTKTKVAYSAPVKQVTDILTGTRATLTVGNIIYTARQGGTGGNSITITVVDSASNNVALSIGVASSAITVNLATDGASAPTSTGAQVLAALQASAAAMALVEVAGTGTMSTVQAAASVASLAGGAAAAALVVGNEMNLNITDMTPMTQPFPTYNYAEVIRTGDTLNTIAARLIARINSTSSFENANKDLIVTASGNGSLITLTAIDYGTSFKVRLTGQYYDIGSVNNLTKMKIGSGWYEHVRIFQEMGDIFRGVQTQYPNQIAANAADFGAPPDLVLATNTYNMYQITMVREEASRTPHNFWKNKATLGIAVPSNGTNPTSAIDTVLGT